MKVADLSDSEEVYRLQKRLMDADDELARLKTKMGQAYHILEYDGDMRKRALATATTPFLEKGESAAAADSWARASFLYEQQMKNLARAHETASEIKFQYEAAKIAIEVARSLLSMEKQLAAL